MWKDGRQIGGYLKLKLAESQYFKFDVYLLKFPRNAMVQTHQDPAPAGYEHHRLNIVLRAAKLGGRFYTILPNGVWQYCTRRIVRFRPDQVDHGMTRVQAGAGLWLSIGWLRHA